LRLGAPKDSELIARRLATVGFGLYASPSYKSKLDGGQTPIVIGYDQESDFISEAAWLRHRFPDQRFSFRSNTQTSQAAAARAGYGLALLPHFLAAGDAALARVWPEEDIPEHDLWLLMRRDLAKVPRMRAVADYLIELFQGERERFHS
jgi:DNA-binding transcriptional LysR family regulator